MNEEFKAYGNAEDIDNSTPQTHLLLILITIRSYLCYVFPA
jgi:hypothetical protein